MSCKDHENERQAEESEVIVVIVPFPAQGHLNQLLHLSRIISSYNIPVHYVSTAIHSRQAKLRVQGWDPLSAPNKMITFHDFSTPSFVSPPPNPHSAAKFPAHLLPSFYAALHLRAPVGELLSALSPTTKRLVVIYDFLFSSVIQDVVSIPNGEAYSFQCVSAFRVSSTVWDITGKPVEIDDQIMEQLPSRSATVIPQVMDFIKMQEEHNKYSSGVIFNTCRPIEGPFLDVLAKVNAKQWALGPFNPMEISNNSSDRRHRCLKWLDKQVPNSVIFVSFGTTTSLTDEQIERLAVGLETSGQKFIWVLRDADKGDIFTGAVRECELPKGFQDRIQVLKIAVVVRDWSRGEELVESLTIENAVRELMASNEGEAIRKRTAELSMAVKRSVTGGEMDNFIAHIRR
uniref:Glycosyltransferase N-terminal domain-containing protein n=1 Tax=Daucus carota subsp. sativus TaxID=79200 RepID=A0A165YEY0_DAUCS